MLIIIEVESVWCNSKMKVVFSHAQLIQQIFDEYYLQTKSVKITQKYNIQILIFLVLFLVGNSIHLFLLTLFG